MARQLLKLSALAWLAIGAIAWVQDVKLHPAYWVAAAVLVMAIVFLEDIPWLLNQDFTAQPWPERDMEFRHLFRFDGGFNKRWGLWLLAVFVVMPLSLVGIALDPPFDRLASAATLLVCLVVGWVGVKFLDARITRRRRGRRSPSDSSR